ncbi:hypothetical protein [Enterovibrio nigricans]|uniref:Uncharacterized protein n=1 Tax=Enterovibrio nigricans DSM 22720 TaxID=1121868 RepID=A0A1T4VSC8_9GAMM|nr:hypothetical protein [Enterovibrio nigricans]PKF49188.1 hypothetical protein AT251_20800 [Enterovibrio nigricans]SKA67892.1 hypothetical protein SAMN02745132_04246 [Enterovibrio nigricans DSM 22720]
MRQKLSFVFFCAATVLILLQLMSNVMELSEEQSEHRLIHTVSRQIDVKPVEVIEKPKVDFKQMAQDMQEEMY